MKRKNIIATSLLTASWFAFGAYGNANDQTPARSAAERQQTSPDISSDRSYGGTQSERERQTGTPLPEGGSFSDTTGTSSQSSNVQRDDSRSAQGQRSQDNSYGGTQSERQHQSGVPFPEGSSYSGAAGTSSQSRNMQSDTTRSAQRQPSQDNSYGGTKSERQHESGVPFPEGSSYSGANRSGMASAHGRWNAMQVKQAQQALKTNGHNPGPVDGIMGPQTREAIKDFQNAKGLQATGTLDEQTAQTLGLRK
jgi:hypothetical protein